MKKCAKCGKENKDVASFCANCGSKLDLSSTNSVNNSINESSVNSSNSVNSTNSTNSTNSPNSPNSINSAKSQNKSDTPATDKLLSNAKTCCIGIIVIFIVFMAIAFIYHDAGENFNTEYGADFRELDLNGDGMLSFEEASQIDTSIPDSDMQRYFNESDTNHNGYLKGHEFDLFADDIRYYNNIDHSKSSDSDKFKYSSGGTTNFLPDEYSSDDSSSSSSSSSGSSRSSSSSSSRSGSSSSSSSSSSRSGSSSSSSYDDYNSDAVATCPYCGSEAIYETGGYYKCGECGRTIYSPDELELNYQEGYLNLIVPVFIMEAFNDCPGVNGGI